MADKKKLFRTVAGGAVALAIVGGGGWWFLHRGEEATDDAQVDAEVVPVPARVGGVVAAVTFRENQVVHEGDVLATIDDALPKAKLAAAEADLASAQAIAEAADADITVISAGGSKEIAQAKAAATAAESAKTTAEAELARQKRLVAANAAPQERLDAAQSAFDGAVSNLEQARARFAAAASGEGSSAKGAVAAQNVQARARAATAHARVQSAQAAHDLAALEVSWTQIKAPREGIASRKTIAQGQMVQPGQPIAMLVPTADVWVTANFKETQLARMKVGQPARVHIDAFPHADIEAQVESFSGATGARFSLLPPDNATGNFTKVVQRIPVRLKLKKVPDGIVLRAGMSADAVVDVAAEPAAPGAVSTPSVATVPH